MKMAPSKAFSASMFWGWERKTEPLISSLDDATVEVEVNAVTIGAT